MGSQTYAMDFFYDFVRFPNGFVTKPLGFLVTPFPQKKPQEDYNIYIYDLRCIQQ